MNLKKFYVAILILLFAIITSDAISYEIPKKSEIKKITAMGSRENPVLMIEYKDGTILMSNILVPEYADNMPLPEQSPAPSPSSPSSPQTSVNNNDGNNNNLSDKLDLNKLSQPKNYDESVSEEWFASHGFQRLAKLRETMPLNTIVITRTGNHYHSLECRSLETWVKVSTIQDAKKSGFTACRSCRPPEK
ncbi:MAG: hypothetical protein IJP69_09335 [Synergistaceae bacterium]|nr:hypothetical protein [Synergistaceae bacterium]